MRSLPSLLLLESWCWTFREVRSPDRSPRGTAPRLRFRMHRGREDNELGQRGGAQVGTLLPCTFPLLCLIPCPAPGPETTEGRPAAMPQSWHQLVQQQHPCHPSATFLWVPRAGGCHLSPIPPGPVSLPRERQGCAHLFQALRPRTLHPGGS